MEIKTQQDYSNQIQSNTEGKFKLLEFYIDSVIRTLIAFSIVIVSILVLNTYIELSVGFRLALAVLIGIIISPSLSKIKIAYLFIDRYVAFLDGIVERITK